MNPFVLLCSVAFFAFMSYEWSRTPMTPLLAKDLGSGPETIGLIMAASTAVGIFVKLPSGVISDVVGRRWVVLAGICFFAFTPFFYFVADSPESLLVLRTLHGFSTAVYGPTAMAVVAGLFKDRRAEGIGWYTACVQTGKSIGPALGGVALSQYGFTSAYLLCGISGLVAFALAVLFVRASGPSANGAERAMQPSPKLPIGTEIRRRFGSGLREIVFNRQVMMICSAQSVQLFALGALQAFVPLYAASLGHPPAAIGLFFGVQSLASLVSRPLMGRLSDRSSRVLMIVAGLGLSAGAFYALPFASRLIPLYALALIYGVGEAITHTSTSAQVADLCKAYALGSAMGLFGSVTDVGHASGQFFTGVLVARLGFTGAYHSVAGLLVVTGLGVLWVFRSSLRGRGQIDRMPS
ncbi:MAG: MFS transporter [Nitrospirae bacterium]|nr:MFS transporter [Nitrospirota bacterium]